jgi:hypothetical protein
MVKPQRKKAVLICKKNFFPERILCQAIENLLSQQFDLIYYDGEHAKLWNIFFQRKLGAIRPKERYRLATKKICLRIFLRATGKVVHEFLKALIKARGDRRKALLFLREIHVCGVKIGDCAFNTYLRNQGDILKINFNLGKNFYNSFVNIYLWQLLFQDKSLNNGRKYFFIPEIVYHDESLRRYLLKKGFLELRQKPENGKLTVLWNRPKGPELALANYFSRKVSKKSLKRAKQELAMFIRRKKSYGAKSKGGSDINVNALFINNEKIQKAAVVFMHMISDAQYYYGPSCFIDLHEWLMVTIDLCARENLPVLIKLHPALFNPDLILPVDQKYLKRIQSIFGIMAEKIHKSKISRTKRPGIYFIHHSISPAQLVKNIPDILFLTHHGTVASEAGFFGKTTIASSAGPYPKDAKFVHSYRSISEYKRLVRSWNRGRLKPPADSQTSLWNWVASRRLQVEEKGHYFWYLLRKYKKAWKIKNPWVFHLELERRGQSPRVYSQLVNTVASLVKPSDLEWRESRG